MKPFNREKFLLYMLAGIFTWQAALFTFGVVKCFGTGGREACPDLGTIYENTVSVMVATTLALLGASAVAGVTKRNSSASDPSLPLASSQEPAQSTAQRPVQESVRESVRARNSGKGS
jgi:hypothetical protein